MPSAPEALRHRRVPFDLIAMRLSIFGKMKAPGGPIRAARRFLSAPEGCARGEEALKL